MSPSVKGSGRSPIGRRQKQEMRDKKITDAATFVAASLKLMGLTQDEIKTALEFNLAVIYQLEEEDLAEGRETE